MEEKTLQRAIDMMIATDRMHRCLFDANVNTFGLHRSQHIILMHLTRTGKIPSQKELSDHIGITPAAVTGALKKLEHDGYISRTTGADTRYREIRITEKGRDIVVKTRRLFREIDSSLFRNFSEDELRQYTDFLEKMQQNIRQYKEEHTTKNRKGIDKTV